MQKCIQNTQYAVDIRSHTDASFLFVFIASLGNMYNFKRLQGTSNSPTHTLPVDVNAKTV